jgi:glutamine phosphoribosylpyrophosphate amidotransferase
VKLESGLDSEVIAALICRDEAPLAEAVANAMGKLEGAYSVTAVVDGRSSRSAIRWAFGL